MRAFRVDSVPRPPDFRPLPIDPSRPLDVEIGCGAGFHPIRYARLHADRQLVAIERTKDKFAKFLGRIQGHEVLPNLIPIHGDAVAWIAHGFRAETIDRYFLLYPNPYPKAAQANRRFHRMPFFAHLRATLKPGGLLTFATNSEPLARETEGSLVTDWGLELASKRVISPDAEPRTHFEKKYLQRGEQCWDLVFRKRPAAIIGVGSADTALS